MEEVALVIDRAWQPLHTLILILVNIKQYRVSHVLTAPIECQLPMAPPGLLETDRELLETDRGLLETDK